MSGLALVTGANGFIGRYVVELLMRRGTSVRALVRRPMALPQDLRGSVDFVIGDVRDPFALRRAVRGASSVFHLAACARAWTPDPDDFVSVNVRAVDALLHAAARAGVERLVHVSTILTLPPNRAAPVTGAARTPTLYEWTKREGERRVEAHVRAGRHAVIVHPARVYGPGPLHDGNGVTRAIALYLQGRLRLRLNDGDALGSYVHAADVAHGIVAAAERGRPGAHYVLGGENVPFTQLLELATSLTGTRRRVISLPPRAALAVARATELWGRVGGTFVLPRAWIRVLMEDRPVDSGPAVRDLGYAPRPLREGLHQTIDWLARQGLIARGARAA